MAFKLISNPPNPWQAASVEWLGEPPTAKLEVFEEHAKSVLSENDSPDLGFRWSVNPYRGCFHACAYCYARPSHQYWDFGAGTDFERKLIVKVNAPEVLEAGFRKKSWQGETVVFSGNTDCYQPLEAVYALTRRCLDVCRAFRNPVSPITKSAHVRRDTELLAELVRVARADVFLSIAFSDDATARALEPGAPVPSARFAAMKALHEAGVPVGVSCAPVIPGVNDSQVAEVLERARACGARRAFMNLLRLPAEVKPVFLERLQAALPGRYKKVTNAILEMREGALNRSAFHERMRGQGERWNAIERLFQVTCRRLGINAMHERDFGAASRSLHAHAGESTFRRPGETMNLFE
ncbi:MAG: PA0069 family radical SAM protein [Planctomycetota bacterium]|nr:PA0069 family radical SAM protein [Planctomycetota bacterium]